MDDRLRRIADHLLPVQDRGPVDPLSIPPGLLPHLFVLSIEPGPPDRPIRLRVRLVGTALDQAFDRALAGHCLEEFMHGPRSAEVIRGFHGCATTREPVWMRQVVRIGDKTPRYVEGVAIFVAPDRIYGGLVVGEAAVEVERAGFKIAPLR